MCHSEFFFKINNWIENRHFPFLRIGLHCLPDIKNVLLNIMSFFSVQCYYGSNRWYCQNWLNLANFVKNIKLLLLLKFCCAEFPDKPNQYNSKNIYISRNYKSDIYYLSEFQYFNSIIGGIFEANRYFIFSFYSLF